MKANGRKNETNESVGKPGMFVAARRPLELIARSRIGNASGAMTFAGWRAVRRMERQAIRRMDEGTLSDEEVERLGRAFMELERIRVAQVPEDGKRRILGPNLARILGL